MEFLKQFQEKLQTKNKTSRPPLSENQSSAESSQDPVCTPFVEKQVTPVPSKTNLQVNVEQRVLSSSPHPQMTPNPLPRSTTPRSQGHSQDPALLEIDFKSTIIPDVNTTRIPVQTPKKLAEKRVSEFDVHPDEPKVPRVIYHGFYNI